MITPTRVANRGKHKSNDNQQKQAGKKSDNSTTPDNTTSKNTEQKTVQLDQHNCNRSTKMNYNGLSNNRISLSIPVANNHDYQRNSVAANQNDSVPFVLPFP
ncbi:MAG: hypothetical protein M3Y53_04640 [Thermoproteota archaeon]|nr:hypothetical protein [Thermoproteota archaeon]